MKTKGAVGLLLAVCMVMSLLCIGAFTAEPDVITDSTPRPGAVVYHNTISATDSSFTTDRFTCTNGNGNSLRFWFRNNGAGECVVRLYKVGFFSSSEVKKITVAPGAAVCDVYSNPGGATFYMTVTCTTGGTISGQLRANQLDLWRKKIRLSGSREMLPEIMKSPGAPLRGFVIFPGQTS